MKNIFEKSQVQLKRISEYGYLAHAKMEAIRLITST